MRQITGLTLAIHLASACLCAAPPEFPTELSKWVRTRPPEAGEDRWFDANQDSEHEWVVFLRGGQPSARLRAVKRSPYPERQEAYPPMPFAIEPGSAKDGLGGEWFSVQVFDGWLIGFNAGEFGAALWWFSPDGKERYRISNDQVNGFVKSGEGLLALEGIAHGTTSRGHIVRLVRRVGGRWQSEPLVDLRGAPEAWARDADGSLIVATHDRLLRVHLRSKQVDVLLKDAFWGGLYPKSLIVAPSGTVFIGMRHGVAEVGKKGGSYEVYWLLPAPEPDR